MVTDTEIKPMPPTRARVRWWVAVYHLVGVALVVGAVAYATILMWWVGLSTSSCGTPDPDDLVDLRRATLASGLGVAAVAALWSLVGWKLTRSSVAWCALALVFAGLALGSAATIEPAKYCMF